MNSVSSKKKLVLILAAVLLVFNAGLVVLYFLVIAPSQSNDPDSNPVPAPPDVAAQAPELSDEYYSIHFNYGDAIELCSMETRSRNSNLVQLTVNEHSTRFKPDENIYLVELDSHVGTPLLFDEKSHTCEIDPATQGVAFYKEITRRKAVRPQ
jgi:hypothetical protein